MANKKDILVRIQEEQELAQRAVEGKDRGMTGTHEIIHADGLELLKAWPESSVDLMFLDLPYNSEEITNTKARDAEKEYFDVKEAADFEEVFVETERVLDTGRHVYVFSDEHAEPVFRGFAEKHNLTFEQRLAWNRGGLDTGYTWRGQLTYILFFRKGKRGRATKYNHLSNVLTHPMPAYFNDDNPLRPDHPRQKPESLFEHLLYNSTFPGELVMDPFCNLGTSGCASVRACRSYIGASKHEKCCEVANKIIGITADTCRDFFKRYK